MKRAASQLPQLIRKKMTRNAYLDSGTVLNDILGCSRRMNLLPTQPLWNRTLAGGPGVQDLATRAWNLTVALLYEFRGLYNGSPAHLMLVESAFAEVGMEQFR